MTPDAGPPSPAGGQCGGSVEGAIPADPELIAEGWVRRHVADPERAAEAIELYTSLGFEVTAQALRTTDFGSECEGCAVAACRSYVMIYTRRPASSRSADPA